AFTGVDSQNLLDVMVSVQFILAIGENFSIKCHIFLLSHVSVNQIIADMVNFGRKISFITKNPD
ncbi:MULTISPECIES: hypothetical protein, partial [Lactobacillales]